MKYQTGAGTKTALSNVSSLLARRWKLILAVFTVVLVPGVCLALALPSVYKARATVIPVGNAFTGAMGSGAANESPFEAVTEQVLGRDHLLALIRDYGLAHDANGNTALAAGAMRKSITIAPARGAHSGSEPFAFTITYRGSDPVTVAEVTNRLAHSYESFSRDMQIEEFSTASVILKKRLGLLRAKLDDQQKLIDKYQASHKGELPDQQDANLAAMQRIDSQLRDNGVRQLQLMENRNQLRQQLSASGSSDLSVLDQRLAELRLNYTEKYPQVVELKRRIARLKAARTADSESDPPTPMETQLADMDTRLDRLQQQEGRLRSQLAIYQGRLEKAPLAAQGIKTLTQGYSETSALYDTLLKRYEQVRIAHATAGGGGPDYQVLESALIPILPSGPSRLRLLLVVIVLGFGLAGLGALIAEQVDTSFHGIDELSAFTNLPVLAAIPVISTPGDIKRRRLLAVSILLAGMCLIGVIGTGAALYAHTNHALAQRFTHHVS